MPTSISDDAYAHVIGGSLRFWPLSSLETMEPASRTTLCRIAQAGELKQRVERRHETPDSRTCVRTPHVSTGWASMKSMISQCHEKVVCWRAACSIDASIEGPYKEGKSFVRAENLGSVGGIVIRDFARAHSQLALA